MGNDVDTESYAWIKSLKDAVEQESKLQRNVKTMDDILCYSVFYSTVRYRAFIVKTFTDRFQIWQHGAQADLEF